MAAGEFDILGNSLPMMAAPAIRLGINTEWFISSFEFVTSPSLGFTKIETVEFQQTSVFAVLDFSLVKLKGGWVFDSRNLVNGQRTDKNPGRGFFISVQWNIPILR